jgi:hypothetical protein
MPPRIQVCVGVAGLGARPMPRFALARLALRYRALVTVGSRRLRELPPLQDTGRIFPKFRIDDVFAHSLNPLRPTSAPPLDLQENRVAAIFAAFILLVEGSSSAEFIESDCAVTSVRKSPALASKPSTNSVAFIPVEPFRCDATRL